MPVEKSRRNCFSDQSGLRLWYNESKKAVRVLTQAAEWARCGLIHDCERKDRVDSNNLIIGEDSFEMQITADAMEGGFGLRLTRDLVNKHQREMILQWLA